MYHLQIHTCTLPQSLVKCSKTQNIFFILVIYYKYVVEVGFSFPDLTHVYYQVPVDGTKIEQVTCLYSFIILLKIRSLNAYLIFIIFSSCSIIFRYCIKISLKKSNNFEPRIELNPNTYNASLAIKCMRT